MCGRSTWRSWRLLCTKYRPAGISVRTQNYDLGSIRVLRQPQLSHSRWTSSDSSTSINAERSDHDASDDSGYLSTQGAHHRIQGLRSAKALLYPRYQGVAHKRSFPWVQKHADGKSHRDRLGMPEDGFEVSGRITSLRLSGSRLVFIDLYESQRKLQVVVSLNALGNEVTPDEFKEYNHQLWKGDYISVRASAPYYANNGQLSVRAVSLPVIQTPCLHRFPVEERGFATTKVNESIYQPRHIEMLTDPEIIETLKLRSKVIRAIRRSLHGQDFVEVSTPILSAQAGGASAKPFETVATEFSDRKLSLRIAPELWLKKLIVGGMNKVFEIGQSFRNEGLDKTHNPEFTTCEFYAVSHDLTRLMTITEQLLQSIHEVLVASRDLTVRADFLQAGFKVLDFVPALNFILDVDLPDLSSPGAQSALLSIFESKDIPPPSSPTIPRLLDKLSSWYLEPQSLTQPLWITNIPECLSPLAKSFIHPTAPNKQAVAARAELFIQGKEVVNCYEEENSPLEQRRKFIAQQHFARTPTTDDLELNVNDEEAMKLDEEYLHALEWGLPPTGGWGCGIDRLVMLFAGKERIGDVLSFGNLRAVTRGAEKVDGQDKESHGGGAKSQSFSIWGNDDM